MSSDKNSQRVLCVQASALAPYSEANGFFELVGSPLTYDRMTPEGVCNSHGVLLPRGFCEIEPYFKQPIVQCVVTVDGLPLVHHIPSTAGEERLHGKSTIFFGGHVDEGDEKSVCNAVIRELHEELGICPIHASGRVKRLGYINYEETLVSRVHFAIVYSLGISMKTFKSLPVGSDAGVANISIKTWHEAAQLMPSMTEWAQIAFPLLRLRLQLSK